MAQEASNRTGIAIASSMWRWGGWVPGFAIAAAARQLLVQFSGDDVVEGVLYSVGVGLLVGGFCLFLTWLAYAIWQAMPSQRLSRMGPALTEAKRSLSVRRPPGYYRFGERYYVSQNPKNISSIREVVRKLDRLRIPHPGVNGSASHWFVYLGRLIGESKARALKAARSLWREMQDEGVTS